MKVATLIKCFCTIVCVVLILITGLLFIGCSSKSEIVNYELTVDNPSSGYMNVKMIVRNNGKPFMHMYLNCPLISNFQRISDVKIKGKNNKLVFWHSLPMLNNSRKSNGIYSIWTGFGNKSVEINYKLYANCIDPKNKQIMNYLNASGGYLYGPNFLLVPLSFQDLKTILLKDASSYTTNPTKATIIFNLPDGWKVNSSGVNNKINAQVSDLMHAIFLLGDINIVKNNDTDIPFTLAVPSIYINVNITDLQKFIVAVINNAENITGYTPNNTVPYKAISIISTTENGLSTADSILARNDKNVIAHEIFHWWNGSSRHETIKDNKWLVEGFTTYYQYKLLYNIGEITDQQFKQAIKNMYVSYLGKQPLENRKTNFINYSTKYSNCKASDQESKEVYLGGALIAYYLDNSLKSENKSLDNLWKEIYENKNPITSSEFIKILGRYGGNDLAVKCNSIINGKESVLENKSIFDELK